MSAENAGRILRAVHSVKAVLFLTCRAEEMFKGLHVNPKPQFILK